jgi:conjugal transfer pilus assembly protein TraU
MNNFWVLLCLCIAFESVAACKGRFVNPLTDICWKCIFPITIAGMQVVGGNRDTKNPKGPICLCKKAGIPVPGVPVSFWEPIFLVDVTRTPWCLVNMGGLQIAGGNNSVNAGSIATRGGSSGHLKHSFYQVHVYTYPVIYWLNLLTDFACLTAGDFDIPYLSELDPLWNDDKISFVLNPEAALFNNQIAQLACAADCLAASGDGTPLEKLFWCAGCQGSMHPFSGSVSAHVGGVQASLLVTQKFLATLHRTLALKGYMGKQGLCGYYNMPIMNKAQYKAQMLYPVAATNKGCYFLGHTDITWNSGKEFPFQGEDFGYLIWRKRNCCML